MGLKVTLVDAPATPRRDITVIGLYGVLFETSVASEVTGVLPKHSFIEVLEGRFSIDVVPDDSGPVIATAVAGGPLGESLELSGCISSVVSAVTTATLPLVLEVSLETVVEWRRQSSVRHRPALCISASLFLAALPRGKCPSEGSAAFVLTRQRQGTSIWS